MGWCLAALFLILWLATGFLWHQDSAESDTCFNTMTYEIRSLYSERKSLTAKVKELEDSAKAELAITQSIMDRAEHFGAELTKVSKQLTTARESLEANVKLNPRKRKPWAEAIKEAFDA